jgi:hypothetical protein
VIRSCIPNELPGPEGQLAGLPWKAWSDLREEAAFAAQDRSIDRQPKPSAGLLEIEVPDPPDKPIADPEAEARPGLPLKSLPWSPLTVLRKN